MGGTRVAPAQTEQLSEGAQAMWRRGKHAAKRKSRILVVFVYLVAPSHPVP